MVAATPALFMVDAISALGAMECRTDAWHIDLCVSGSHKALMLPPGLAFVSVSDKAWQQIDKNPSRTVQCLKQDRQDDIKSHPLLGVALPVESEFLKISIVGKLMKKRSSKPLFSLMKCLIANAIGSSSCINLSGMPE